MAELAWLTKAEVARLFEIDPRTVDRKLESVDPRFVQRDVRPVLISVELVESGHFGVSRGELLEQIEFHEAQTRQYIENNKELRDRIAQDGLKATIELVQQKNELLEQRLEESERDRVRLREALAALVGIESSPQR